MVTAMFARRMSSLAPAGAAAQGGLLAGVPLPAWLSNPFVGAGGTGAGVLLLGAALIALFGDPTAGTPTFRAPLGSDTGGASRLRSILGEPGVPGEVGLDTLTPGAELNMVGPDGKPFGGQAVITLPGGDKSASVLTPRKFVPSPLPAAPIAGLAAPSPTGPLPVIADGRKSSDVYARPFQSNGKPKIALVIGGLGLNAAQTRAAIEQLPPEVTLSFVPYADGLQGWIDQARAQGHEVMLEIPMEPLDYPQNDPGPYTLMAQARPEETVKRLEWLLSRATGYFAVTNYLGGKFMSSSEAMNPFMSALKTRGLAFLDDGSGKPGSLAGLPRASADRIVDDQLAPEAIDKQFLALEAAALQRGAALGAGFAYPVTLEQAARWTQSLPARGYQLAPASAITRR
jgi:hypothetical protein